MILNIVLALCIFFFGIPLTLWILSELCNTLGRIADAVMEFLFGALNAFASALGWLAGCIIRVYSIVRAQVQNLG